MPKQRCAVYSRIVGYISPLSLWNDGKKEEYLDRKVYKPPGGEKNGSN